MSQEKLEALRRMDANLREIVEDGSTFLSERFKELLSEAIARYLLGARALNSTLPILCFRDAVKRWPESSLAWYGLFWAVAVCDHGSGSPEGQKALEKAIELGCCYVHASEQSLGLEPLGADLEAVRPGGERRPQAGHGPELRTHAQIYFRALNHPRVPHAKAGTLALGDPAGAGPTSPSVTRTSEAPSYRHADTDIVFPDRIGTWQSTRPKGVDRYPGGGEGITYQHAGVSSWVSVIIYPGEPASDDGGRSDAVVSEFGRTLKEIGKVLRIVEPFVPSYFDVGPGFQAARFRCLDADGDDLRSGVYLTSVDDYFVKLRASYVKGRHDHAAEQAVDRLVASIARRLAPRCLLPEGATPKKPLPVRRRKSPRRWWQFWRRRS